jgi:hypothetical protein
MRSFYFYVNFIYSTLYKLFFVNKNKKNIILDVNWNHNLIYSHTKVNVWLCPKYMCIWVQNYYCGTKIAKLDLFYIELCDGCGNFVNNVYSHFVKIIWIFYDRLMDTKYITVEIFQFLDKI